MKFLRTAAARLATLLVPLALAACVGGGSSGGGAPLKPYADFDLASTSPRTCDTLALSAASAQPLDTITVSGLPAAFAQIAVYVETDPGGVGLLTPTGPVSGGEAEFRVPVAPDGSPDGGAVRLTVTDTTESCPAVAFTIDPLPPAPAGYDAYMADLGDAVRAFLDRAARSYGSSYAELSGAPTPPDNAFLPIYVAIRIFEAVVETPPSDLTDAQKQLVVRVLAKAGALGAFTDAAAAIDQWLADYGPTVLSSPSPSAKPAGAAAPRRKDDGCKVLPPPQIDIPSTERLSEIMNNPAGDQISGALDTFNSAMGFLSSALGVVGASGLTDFLGAMGSITQMVVDFSRAAAPSAFTSLTFDVESPIWEDKSPVESAWSNAEASVTSTSFNVTRAVTKQLVNLAGMAPVGGWAITVINYSYEDEVDAVIDELANNETLCVEIGDQQWGPFDVTASDWTTSEFFGTAVTKMTHNTYLPAMLGQSEIRVRIRPEKFGNAFFNPASNFVTVNAKTVSISPISPKVDKPGDPVHLQVSVNAYYPEAIEWTPPAGAGEVTHVYQGGGIHTFDFASPGSENLFPAPFRVASTSGEVPPDTFERADSVDILLNTGLQIAGARGCISPGEQVDLEAVLSGFTDPDAKVVTWTPSAGALQVQSPTRLATYTAPPTLGTVTVKAETPAPGIGTEPLSDQVEMRVSETCVRQFVTAYLKSTADGDPDCRGPLTSRADIPEEADSVDSFEDYAGTHIPTPEGPYFSGDPVSLATQSSFVASTPVTRGGAPACETMQPSAQAAVDITGDKESTFAMHAEFDDRGTCTTDDSGPVCDIGATGYVVTHYIYLPIVAPGTYRLTVELACSQFVPHYGDLQFFVTRWVDGTDATVPNGPDSTPTPENPQPAVPFVPGIFSFGFECDGAAHTQTMDMELVGPLGDTGSDLVTLFYGVGPVGSTVGLTPQEIQENNDALDPFGQGPSPDFIQSLDVNTTLERLD